MVLNSIYSSNYNYGIQVMLCITTDSVSSYNNQGFFNSGNGGSSIPTGVAETLYLLACWLGLNYVCTSAYKDFYFSETTDLVHTVFPFSNQLSQNSVTLSIYNPEGKLSVLNQNTVSYSSNTSNSISIIGNDTGGLTWNTGTVTISNY
jgi:hypothetical protein